MNDCAGCTSCGLPFLEHVEAADGWLYVPSRGRRCRRARSSVRATNDARDKRNVSCAMGGLRHDQAVWQGEIVCSRCSVVIKPRPLASVAKAG